MTLNDFMEKMLAAFPDAEVGEDNDRQLIIYTGLRHNFGGSVTPLEEHPADLYGQTLTIGDIKVTLTREQVEEWNDLDLIYPCDAADHGWHIVNN